MLVVGPNRTFMEYVSHVLPALGEASVEQRAVGELVDGVAPKLARPADVARLKADAAAGGRARARGRATPAARAGGTRRAARGRVRSCQGARARSPSWSGDRGSEHGTTRRRARALPHGRCCARFYEEYGARTAGAARPRLRGGRAGAAVEGLPRPRSSSARGRPSTPERLVRSLLSSRAFWPRRLTASSTRTSSGCCGARGGWSDADVPLLDEAHALVGAPPRAYGHVIVDEAQDLTPMQLRMIARRAPCGAMTILGDVAQATGPVAYARWEDVLPHLPRRRRGGGRGAPPRLPRAARDHGAGAAAARRDRARTSSRRSRTAPARPQPSAAAWAEDELLRRRTARRRGSRRGRLLALIVPDELVEPALAHGAPSTSDPAADSARGRRASSSTT